MAAFQWGALVGMRNFMTDAGYKHWPDAEKSCGYFSPTQDWIKAAELAAVPVPKIVKKKAA